MEAVLYLPVMAATGGSSVRGARIWAAGTQTRKKSANVVTELFLVHMRQFALHRRAVRLATEVGVESVDGELGRRASTHFIRSV